MVFIPHPRSGVGKFQSRYVVLARLEADFSDQPPSLPAVPNHQVSLQCPTTKYPCNAQLPSILTVPNRRVSLHCPTAKYPCNLQCSTTKYPRSAQRQSISAVPNCKVSLQCPTTKYPCGPNRKVSLQCPTAEYPWSAQQQSINILAVHLQRCKEDSRGGGGKRYTSCAITSLGWGCSK